jgi:hypothetical protein
MAIMRQAAMEAGIVPSINSPALVLATEPEAAALVAQQSRDLLGLGLGDKFMVWGRERQRELRKEVMCYGVMGRAPGCGKYTVPLPLFHSWYSILLLAALELSA